MWISSRRAVSLLPLILLIAAPALAAPRWAPLGPFGGTIDTLAVAPSDARVIYVTTRSEGAFRSTDGGASWVPIHGDFISSNVAIHPARPGTLYLATAAEKLVKSMDFGSHWTVASRGLEGAGVSAVAVDPAHPSRLYAGVDLRVFRSTNGGASWKPARQAFPASYDTRIQALVAVPRPAGTVFALASGKLFKSGDAGDTWKTLERGLPGGIVTALAVSPSEPWVLYAAYQDGSLFRSRNFGTSWEPAGRQPGSLVLSLAVSPRSSRTVWAGTQGKGLLVSFDGGAHWRKAGPSSLVKITAVAVPLSSPRTVFAATMPQGLDPGGVFASEDGGATWARRNRGLAGLPVYAVAVDPGTRDLLWTALGVQGLYRSANGGQDWTLLPYPAIGLVMTPSAPSTLYAVRPPRAWRTDDGGGSWSEIGGDSAPVPGPLCVDPVSPTTLWSYGRQLFKSVDAGATWAGQTLPSPGNAEILAFAPSLPSTMYAAGYAGTAAHFSRTTAWRSTDGGATWTAIDHDLRDSEATALAIDPVDPRLVYLATCGLYCSPGWGMWKSTDGGASWRVLSGTALEGHTVTALAASPLAGVVWAAGNSGKVFRSTDYGETWQERSEGLQAYVTYELILDPYDSRRVYAATSNGLWVLEDGL